VRGGLKGGRVPWDPYKQPTPISEGRTRGGELWDLYIQLTPLSEGRKVGGGR